MKRLSDIGLVGLGVMGESLALNMESKGFNVSVYNYINEVTDRFISGRGAGKNFVGAHSYAELVASLEAPRKVFLMGLPERLWMKSYHSSLPCCLRAT